MTNPAYAGLFFVHRSGRPGAVVQLAQKDDEKFVQYY